LSDKILYRASTHDLVDPRSTNYRIPVYIKASEDVSNAVIEKLVIVFDINNFYPSKVDNGTIKLDIIDNTVIETVLENVKVSNLTANKEVTLLTIRGNAILGDKDSSGILVKEVNFEKELNTELELINGYITIDICREGGDRLIRIFEYNPAVIVKVNPVTTGVLEAQCKTIVKGKYTLEIVDMLGATTLVEEFTAGPPNNWIFDFNTPVLNYAIGSYILVMTPPSPTANNRRYITKFIIFE
jgi:hypothetical protein